MFDWLKRKWDGAAKEKPMTASSPLSSSNSHSKNKNTIHHAHIVHDPNLIKRLTDEHIVLLNAYNVILKAVEAENFSLVALKLYEFGETLRAHLLAEHVELYIYLEYVLAQDSQEFNTMHQLRVEMDKISADVMGFLNRYQSNPVCQKTADQFKVQFLEVGQVLSSRIKREEEHLYKLYRPEKALHQ